MRFLVGLVALLSTPAAVQGKAVFAHFMVGNTAQFTVADWTNNIALAQAAGIDAFALNMAKDEATTTSSVPLAFTAAQSKGFKLFFSFDYAGNGAWDKATVTALISKYAGSSAYYLRGSQPLVSTFEGPENAADWKDIKKSTNCFFIPDWSSLGARDAIGLAGGVADGLFSWDAWPKGPVNTNTYPDASYYEFLKGKPYMAAVSPWFYTNLPGYDKNWLWRGDSLWFDRWQQIVALDHQPEFIQIISWNDYGESHYIGPLDSRQYTAFQTGRAPYNYVENMPHDGWRNDLPYWISLYKTGTASVTQESVTGWYRLNPKGACADGTTTGNTASQLLLEYAPAEIIQDKIFFTARLGSKADVSVTLGGTQISASWSTQPYGGVGIYFGSADTKGATGAVTITITRNGAQVAKLTGQAITTSCTSGLNNYNAWVGAGLGGSIAAAKPPMLVSALNCTQGSGFGNFQGLCEFTCANGYCPSSACYCTNLGVATPPKITGQPGYPLPGASPSYEGICSFACNHNYCPSTACGPTKYPTVIPTTGEFLAPTCTKGTGPGVFEGLCDYACNFGYCPMHLCTCSGTGALHVPPAQNSSIHATAEGLQDYGICNFACQRNYCPEPCKSSTTSPFPGGVFFPIGGDEGSNQGDFPWPLLYISNGYTTVHLDDSTSDLVVKILSSSACRRARRSRHEHHLQSRDAVTDCIVSTFTALVANAEFLARVIEIAQGGPPPNFKDITALPAYSDASQQAAFLEALMLGVSQLEQVLEILDASEMILITYAIVDIAIQNIWYHPPNFYSLTVPRAGAMKSACPAVAQNPCDHTLCQGGGNSICTGWLKGCQCTKGSSCPLDDQEGFPLFCNQCGGADILDGRCFSGANEGCPCLTLWEPDPYVWYENKASWNRAEEAFRALVSL